MGLHLTSTDLVLLADATRRLLSPLDYACADAWRGSATRRMKRLLRADMGTFVLPHAAGRPNFTEDFDQDGARDYCTQLRRLERKFGFASRQARLRVHAREMVIAPFRDAYYRSSYYNDYIAPRRAFDAVGISIRTPYGGNGGSICHLLYHHDSESKQPFGERGLALLRLVVPAFRAGIDAFERLHAVRSDLARTLDGLSEAILLFDSRGGLVHQTPAATRVLESDPGGRLHDSVAAVVHSLTRSSLVPAAPAVQDLRTLSRDFTVRGTYAGEKLLGGAPGIVVTIQPRRAMYGVNEDDLRKRFGLTRQEARVASLLAERRTNAEIAETLCISPHTARHHTEKVLGKLGINSRKEVAGVLAR